MAETPDLYEKAVAYVLTMPKTEKQVRQWFAKKTTDQALIDADIARLKEYNLLNDAEYAQAFVQCKKDKMGVGLIKNKLRLNGVAPDLIEKAVAAVDDQADLARACAEKYLRHKERTPETKAKLFRWLLSKGLAYEVCTEVVNEYWH